MTGSGCDYTGLSTRNEGIDHEQAHLYRRARGRHPRRAGILWVSLIGSNEG